MKRFNYRAALSAVLILAGCSSPPEPAKVEWDQPVTATNSSLPAWQGNSVVTPSPFVSGHWSTIITDFQDEGTLRAPDVWYAVAHSPHSAVAAPDAATFFAAKAWLRQHGAKGLITWQPGNSLTSNTRLYLSR
ncbi:cag pathogenicity island Cag12 family protein [Serratia fonticola]|uniref:cag pathogenicity island Cag12 family protein n=1 Tax=Serratia fonticola TaxID=47917 RepID=UPI00301D0944